MALAILVFQPCVPLPPVQLEPIEREGTVGRALEQNEQVQRVIFL
jgi:hypothetical protein